MPDKNPLHPLWRWFLLFVLLTLLMSACTSVSVSEMMNNTRWAESALIILQGVTLLVMLGGLFSLLLLIMPGLTIIWLAALLYAILTGLDWTSGMIFAAISLLMIFGNLVDQLLMGAKARKSGASWLGVLASMLAAFIFSFVFPPFGGFVAALLVLFSVEAWRLKDIRKAGNSTREMATGCASAILARFAIGVLMIALWLLWVWMCGDWPF